MKALSETINYWWSHDATRPDEWVMQEWERNAKTLETRIKELEAESKDKSQLLASFGSRIAELESINNELMTQARLTEK